MSSEQGDVDRAARSWSIAPSIESNPTSCTQPPAAHVSCVQLTPSPQSTGVNAQAPPTHASVVHASPSSQGVAVARHAPSEHSPTRHASE
jgi:hypothetical protein